jgi:hypothetical protein
MHDEIVEFVKAGKPVVFMRPGVVPERFLQGELPLPKPAPKVPTGDMGRLWQQQQALMDRGATWPPPSANCR